MKLKLNKSYSSALIANAELHAGGLFFCIIYANCLTFQQDGKVILSKRVIDPFRPMDPQDVKHLEDYKIQGQYYYNDRDYIVCEFDEIYLKYTGMATNDKSNCLVFYVYDSRTLKHWSEIYELENILGSD